MNEVETFYFFHLPLVPGGWSAWTNGTCSAVCGVGVMTQTRTCTDPEPQFGGANCSYATHGDSKPNVICNDGPCPSKENYHNSICFIFDLDCHFAIQQFMVAGATGQTLAHVHKHVAEGS